VSVPLSKPSVTYITTNVAKAAATWDGGRWGVTLQLPQSSRRAARAATRQ
jgi:hypothetical protein